MSKRRMWWRWINEFNNRKLTFGFVNRLIIWLWMCLCLSVCISFQMLAFVVLFFFLYVAVAELLLLVCLERIPISWYVVDRTCALHQRNEPRKFMFYHQPTQNEMKLFLRCCFFPLLLSSSDSTSLLCFFHLSAWNKTVYWFSPKIHRNSPANEEKAASNTKSSHYRNEFKQTESFGRENLNAAMWWVCI